MVSALKVLQCIRKLRAGQENPDRRTHALTHSHCDDYVELTQAGSTKITIYNIKLFSVVEMTLHQIDCYMVKQYRTVKYNVGYLTN